MIEQQQLYDVAIVGAGFGGSLLALCLHKLGVRVVLFDTGHHPRFAIGESSTPIADMLLKNLAKRYDLPELEPLCQFGSWVKTHPDICCGLKRGFSYFFHQSHQPFTTDTLHRNELLVAASANDEHADTHWLRADVDLFFVNLVQAAGVPYFDQTQLCIHSNTDLLWELNATRLQKRTRCCANFIIDASGGGRFLQHQLNIPEHHYNFQTNSRSIFAHFADVQPWTEFLTEQGISTNDYPFNCDAAALHQVIDEGWMWQLRFRNEITSCGFTLNRHKVVSDESLPAEEEWQTILKQYPSLKKQFAQSRIVGPATGLQKTGRLQRLCSQVVGTDWAMLPNTAGFVDPLHSTGIAHTLSGVSRLAEILSCSQTEIPLLLQDYQHSIWDEFRLIDTLVAGCYQAISPDRFRAWTMLYFAAATTSEARRLENPVESSRSFLLAHDRLFQHLVANLLPAHHQHLTDEEYAKLLAKNLHPYNHVGLCDPTANNMYRYTVANKSS